MAKKKKEKEEKDIADEKADSIDSGEEEAGQDTDDRAPEDVSAPEEKAAGPGPSVIRRWWWVPGLLIFVLIVAGTAVFFKPDLLDAIKGKKKPDYSIDLSNDNLREDDLSPFFVPAPDGSSRGAVRVDLSVIWDGVASVRYKANELKVRAEVYDYLTDIDGKIEDPEELKNVMEEGMTGIFRKSLGAKDLVVRIKELKVI